MKHAIMLAMDFERHAYRDLADILKAFKNEFNKRGFVPSGQLFVFEGEEQQARINAQSVLDEITEVLYESYGDIRNYIKDFTLITMNPVANLLEEKGMDIEVIEIENFEEIYMCGGVQ